MATRRRRRKSKKRTCRFGRSPYTGKCYRKSSTRRRRSKSGGRKGCKLVTIRGSRRKQRMCWSARKRRYLFAS